MTSTSDTAGHPDVMEISDLTEGLLPPARSAEVRRHLDACELCADAHASLEEIRNLLGTVPGPPRMPVDVAGRIDTALAAEALLSATAPAGDDGPVRAGAPGEPTGTSTERHVSRETSISADRPAGRPRTATGPGRKNHGRSRRKRIAALGAVLTAALLGAGSLLLQSLGSGTSDTTAHGRPSASAAGFSGASVQSQVTDLLATKKSLPRESGQHPRGTGSDEDTPTATQSANTLLETEVPVPDCVRQALASHSSVLGAKPGTYAGKTAYLVVVPNAEDGSRVTAYVIDASCVRQQTTPTGKVLLKQSLVRP
ncbi:hypothetical protein QQY24_16090 [Streptomyces sp. TG1A-8]|uniref:anti-sigma factor family protein n=1 Tax=Streptomyces sp. TG1A-8 TaxID=3051385 RepID=UPI00265B765B|nr:hypothetical protein [Streptomyces sp. TG1A-8]MDO0926863.1 hypothetical protein [Streptomyces sp. TG1A-8]